MTFDLGASQLPAGEIIWNGRRYLLIPADADEPQPPAPPPMPADRYGVTQRELEIAALVAEGKVNKEIADRLGISGHTVATHLRRIFSKLMVETRAEMVARLAPLIEPRRGGRARR